MPRLAVRLLTGRFHATPWGRLANEGAVEWPPSPWRLLRALIAAGFTRGAWNAVPPDATEVIDHLASVDPVYKLPAAIAAHTRHWMPTSNGKTRVLDPFVAVSRDEPILVDYPCQLTTALEGYLDVMVRNLAYLGRAESWIEAQLSATGGAVDEGWCRPATETDPDVEKVPLLALLTPDAYTAWSTARNDRVSFSSGRRKSVLTLPATLVDCLLADTGRLQKEGWTQPPGTRWVLYTRPAEVIRATASRSSRSSLGRTTVEAILLKLAAVPGTDGRRGVLPLMARAVPQAEFLHQAAVAHLSDDAASCSVLTGRTPDGEPLEGHGHAHYLPLDLDHDGRIEHFLVYAPAGLDPPAQSAIAGIQRSWTKHQVGHLLVRVVGAGDVQTFAQQLARTGKGALPILARARVWSSVTPFVPPRFLKKKRHTLVDQVADELQGRGFPAPQAVEVLPIAEVQRRRLLSFVCSRRSGKPQPPVPRRLGLRITFAEEVQGPIAIGYGSHFGLGLFRAERDGG